MEIKEYKLTDNQYIKERIDKKQIFLHHTAGNNSAKNTINWWKSNVDKVATAYVIDGSGEIYQCFDDKYWAYHLGLKGDWFKKFNLSYRILDKLSIGIEICNWGFLTKKEDGYYNYVNQKIKDEDVYTLKTPFKNYKHYQNYTDAQLNSTKELLCHLTDKYNITKVYNEDIWDITKRAFIGDQGIFTHNSVRHDKSDVYPHHKLIEILKNL